MEFEKTMFAAYRPVVFLEAEVRVFSAAYQNGTVSGSLKLMTDMVLICSYLRNTNPSTKRWTHCSVRARVFGFIETLICHRPHLGKH